MGKDDATRIAESGVAVTPTGIDEFDVVLKGGTPSGHTILLAGASGTGKTVLGMEWLFRGYQELEQPGLYITLTESVTEATANLAPMSFYQKSLVDGSHVRFADLRTTFQILGMDEDLGKEDIDDIIDAIEQLVEDTGAERLVLDSITAVAYLLQDRDLIRTFVFRLGTMLNHHDVTTILTSEVPDEGYSRYGVEEFVSDGIITLKQEPVADDLRRSLQVVKMRGHDYMSEEIHFSITSDGINLFVNDYPLDVPASDRRVETGIPGLDKMMGDGLLEGSLTLVTGSSGVGKTLSGLQFLWQGVADGESCLFVGFEESEEQLQQMLSHFGWDFTDARDDGLFHCTCQRPETMYPEEHVARIADLVQQHDVDRVVVDSLSAIESVHDDEDYAAFARELSLLLKSEGVTSMLTAFRDNLSQGTSMKTAVSTLVDNIILLNLTEVDGQMQHSVTVLKTRSSKHDTKIRDYTISQDGIQIGAPMTGYEGLMTGSARKTGENVVDQLRNEFTHVLGPMGRTDFEELHADGLTWPRIDEYIGTLEKQSVIDADQAQEFRHRVRQLLQGETVPQPEQNDGKKEAKDDGFLDRLL